MPSAVPRGPQQANKGVGLGKPHKGTTKFTTVDHIRAALRTQNPESLIEALTALRNQFTIRFGEPAITLQDERLLLAQRWLDAVPAAYEIFGIWENVNQRQTSVIALLVSVISSVVTLLSSYLSYHPLGQPIVKILLTPPWMRRLNSYLGGSHTELILVTLKLFNSMSAFASGKERKSVLEAFAWETKSLPKFLNMRRKSKDGEYQSDPLGKPDIRTLYILFILSFLGFDSPTQVKTAFLEQHRDAFLSIFKGLVQDSYPVARKILEVCWAGIWSDPKIKRTLKIGLFNEATISHMLKLYDRVTSDDPNVGEIPADLVHHFLLAICTRPGTGICFKDRGWYPRESEGEEVISNEVEAGDNVIPRGGKIYNKMLANILRTLKVNEDLLQQELALKVMTACPELVAGYWAGAALTLEPRLSSKWIANVSFFGLVISVPIPTPTFLLPNPINTKQTLYQPTPPSLQAILENVLPSVNTKINFSRGLLSASALVQHCTALALVKCLIKYERVSSVFKEVAGALDEDAETGQWRKRWREVEREARKRVPDFQVIVAFSQQKSGEGASSAGHPAPPQPQNKTKAALLAECAMRLLWMYHRCLPSLVAEARFDVGKLLQNFSDAHYGDVDSGGDGPNPATRLNIIRQLHVLRLLKDSNQFVWAGKTGSSQHNSLYVLLKAFNITDVPATRIALTTLLRHVLSESILFQEDPEEPYLWLSSIPTTRRAPGTESPDGALLTDEGESVITFLDDCVQRCLKTPYRYVEELYALTASDARAGRLDTYPSPLLMTVLEQLTAKVAHQFLSPSDVLALATFIRKLTFKLSGKQLDLESLRSFADKVNNVLGSEQLFAQYPSMSAAIRREIQILQGCLRHLQKAPPPQPTETSTAVQDFLGQIEELPISASKMSRAAAAPELVDWLRLADEPLRSTEVQRLVVVIKRFHQSALSEFSENLSLVSGLLWDGMDVTSQSADLRNQLRFEWLFIHSDDEQVTNPACRSILVDAVFAGSPTLFEVKRALRLITHSVSASQDREHLTQCLLFLLASIMKRASSVRSSPDLTALKEFIFLQSEVIKGLCVSQSLTNIMLDGLRTFLDVSLDPANKKDRKLATDISSFWLNILKEGLGLQNQNQVASASLWIKYLQPEDLFDLLDILGDSVDRSRDPLVLSLLRTVLSALQRSTTSESESEAALRLRLDQLLSLRPILADSSVLEEMTAIAIDACLPMCHDGRHILPHDVEQRSLASLVIRSDARWSRHPDPPPADLDLHSFLRQTSWSKSTIKIISGLLYRQSFSRIIFPRWLESDNCGHRSTHDLAILLHGSFDSSLSQGDKIADLKGDAWIPHFSRLLKAVTDHRRPREMRSICGSCISAMLASIPPKRLQFLALLVKEAQALPVTSFTAELLTIARRLHITSPADTKDIVTHLVEKGLQWAVGCFSENTATTDDARRILEELTLLVKTTSENKSHLVETVLTAAVQNRLNNIPALNFVSVLLQLTQLKPLIVNRHLQGILQHPHFFKVCSVAGLGDSPTRDAVIDVLHGLFHLHPWNTCQATHVEPLVHIYRGSLSVSDRKLLSIFKLFEIHRKASVASLLGRWSSSPGTTSTTPLEAVQSLDATVVLRTCLAFPNWRRLEDQTMENGNSRDNQLYDPMFLTLIFAQMLSDSPPTSAFGWVELFRTNIVSLLIRSMSSKDSRIREVALCQIAGLWKYIEVADMQERPHVMYILNLLKDALPVPSNEPPIRLPSYTTLILLHALRGVFYPSNFIYPLTARFLLQRPELDTSDVPMLYGMLYSSSDEWKKERGWIIRFLSDGMMSTGDWRVFKRRHTWDLLSSLFQSSEKDRALRNGIFEVLANLTCNSQATTSLVHKSALLSWIEMQLINSREDDGVAWVKILENILVVLDPAKMESATNGEWRSVIARCLSLLLDDSRTASTASVFPLAAPVILRLSLLPGLSIPHLPSLLTQAVDCIKRLERSTDIPIMWTTQPPSELPLPPHTSHGLHELRESCDPVQIWGQSVEALWRASMTLDTKPPTWDALTSRLLIWRSIVGEDGSAVGEWARKEVVRNLCL